VRAASGFEKKAIFATVGGGKFNSLEGREVVSREKPKGTLRAAREGARWGVRTSGVLFWVSSKGMGSSTII